MSIDTTIAKRDEHLRSDEFFNVAKFPEITFKSRRVKQTRANTGEIAGDLMMHGVTRAITLRVELLGGPESLAKTQWQHVADSRDRRSDLQGWNQTRRLNCRGHPLLLGIPRLS